MQFLKFHEISGTSSRAKIAKTFEAYSGKNLHCVHVKHVKSLLEIKFFFTNFIFFKYKRIQKGENKCKDKEDDGNMQ